MRGDRSVFYPFTPATATTLRTKGTLFTPGHLPNSTTVGGTLQESVGNPYASAINLKNLTFPAGVNTTVITWDPTIGGVNGFGAFQTLFHWGNGMIM